MRRSRRTFCWVLAIPLWASGCTTTTYTPSTEAATRELRIAPGDRVRVLTTRRERLTFDVAEIQRDRLIGTTTAFPYPKDIRSGGQTVHVPFDELAMVQVTRVDSRAAALATLVVVVTISAIGAVVGAAAVPVVPPVVP